MPSFTVHTPAAGTDERAIFVSDGWSWPAFIFGPFWLGWHRQWIALVGYVALWLALTYAGRLFGLHPMAASLLSTLLNIGLALEGGQIRRWTLARNAMPAVAVVSARNADEAEIKYFVAAGTARPADQPAASSPVWTARPQPVLGSFPEPGGR
jgi:hypothetical protein